MSKVLDIIGLRIDLETSSKTVSPVGPVSFSLEAGKCFGIVGESGSGKSLTLKAMLGLLPDGLFLGAGRVQIAEDGIMALREPAELRGHRIGLISQEPGAALDPLMRVGSLIAEIVREHSGCSKSDAWDRAVDLMRQVGIPDPERRATFWPHELSGGLKQRVVISMALASNSDILLCDEPTTALDVTIQAQIVRLLQRLQHEQGLGLVFVTHDLALVHEIADDIAIMYAGEIVETGPAQSVFANPHHPYTRALLDALPHIDSVGAVLEPIPGTPPAPTDFPIGCRFAPRCKHAIAECIAASPGLEDTGHGTRIACCNWRHVAEDQQ